QRSMKNIATLLLVVVASLPLVGKSKHKEKSYEPVRITDVGQLAGRYVGINPDYVIDLNVSADGLISGRMRDFGRTAGLENIHNGQVAFGLMVHDADVQIDDVSLSQLFCRKE